MTKKSDDPCYVPPSKRNKFTPEMKKMLEEPFALNFICRGCGRETLIIGSNNIAIEIKCQVCGSSVFKREVMDLGKQA